MTIKEQIEIMEAGDNGSKIELRGPDKVYRELRDATTHEFNFQDLRDRIQKPKVQSLEDGTKDALCRCLLKLDEVSYELAALIEEIK